MIPEVDFPPSRIGLGLRAIGAVLGAITGVLFTAIGVLTPIPEGGLALRVLVTTAGMGFACLLTFESVTDRPPSLDNSGLSLQVAIRRMDRTRSRRVLFSEMAQVEPKVLEGYNGLEIVLSDGVRTFLPQSAFGWRGLDAMNALCTRFGRSYQDEIARFLLEEREGQRFRVVRIRRTRGEYLILNRSIPTYSGTTSKKVSRRAVVRVQRVSTPSTGVAFLLTLKDGTRFLVPEQSSEVWGLSPS